jgi:hypothetical protein
VSQTKPRLGVLEIGQIQLKEDFHGTGPFRVRARCALANAIKTFSVAKPIWELVLFRDGQLKFPSSYNVYRICGHKQIRLCLNNWLGTKRMLNPSQMKN